METPRHFLLFYAVTPVLHKGVRNRPPSVGGRGRTNVDFTTIFNGNLWAFVFLLAYFKPFKKLVRASSSSELIFLARTNFIPHNTDFRYWWFVAYKH